MFFDHQYPIGCANIYIMKDLTQTAVQPEQQMELTQLTNSFSLKSISSHKFFSIIRNNSTISTTYIHQIATAWCTQNRKRPTSKASQAPRQSMTSNGCHTSWKLEFIISPAGLWCRRHKSTMCFVVVSASTAAHSHSCHNLHPAHILGARCATSVIRCPRGHRAWHP